jgi:hypothetical protein
MRRPDRTACSVARTIAAAIAAVVTSGLPAAAEQPPLSTVLARATAYVLDYQKQLSAIVAEETYVQETVASQGSSVPGRVVLQRRELKSDLLIVRIKGADRWLQYRDVFEVDGAPVRDREERLTELFLGPDSGVSARVGRIRRESARYNIGDVERTMNVPVLPLTVLDPDARSRFRFTREKNARGETRTAAPLPSSPHFKVTTEVWIVRFEERRGPTLVRTPNGRDIFSRGRLWIEPATGRVLMSEMITANPDVRGQINVSYQSEPLLGMLVPIEMRETYTAGRRAPRIEGTATYGRFRQFQVSIDERLGPIQK